MTRAGLSDHGHLLLVLRLFARQLAAEAGSENTQRVFTRVLGRFLIWILSAALSQLVVDPLAPTDENSAHLYYYCCISW